MGAAVLGVDLTERGNGGQGGTRPCTPSNCRRRTVPRGTIWLTTQSGLLISLDEHSSSVFCASGERHWCQSRHALTSWPTRAAMALEGASKASHVL